MDLTTSVDDERRAAKVSRYVYTPCAVDGCERSPANGAALHRVNLYGEEGIFMCAEHASKVDAPPRPPR